MSKINIRLKKKKRKKRTWVLPRLSPVWSLLGSSCSCGKAVSCLGRPPAPPSARPPATSRPPSAQLPPPGREEEIHQKRWVQPPSVRRVLQSGRFSSNVQSWQFLQVQRPLCSFTPTKRWGHFMKKWSEASRPWSLFCECLGEERKGGRRKKEKPLRGCWCRFSCVSQIRRVWTSGGQSRNRGRLSWKIWAEPDMCSDHIFEIPSGHTQLGDCHDGCLGGLEMVTLQSMLSTKTDSPSLSHVYCRPQTADVSQTRMSVPQYVLYVLHVYVLQVCRSRNNNISVVVLATHHPCQP